MLKWQCHRSERSLNARRTFSLPLTIVSRATKHLVSVMAASSSEEASENVKGSVSVLRGLLSELNLDFCAEDYSKYIKVDVSSEV